MKNIIMPFIAFCLLCVLTVVCANYFTSSFNKIDKKYQNELGHKVVIGNDTSVILNYSLLDETFALSNGSKVSSSFVFNNSK
jgi:ABC-type Fe3+-citrate transport system substrate-binding protein